MKNEQSCILDFDLHFITIIKEQDLFKNFQQNTNYC